MAKRPSKIIIEPARARAIRGPHKDDPKSFYWRCEYHHDGTSDTVWTGWGTRQEVREIITELVAAKGLERMVQQAHLRRGDITHIATVEHLMRAWLAWWLNRDGAKDKTLRTYRYAAKTIVHGLPKNYTPSGVSAKERVGGLGDKRIARLDLTILENWKKATLKQWAKLKQEEFAAVEVKLAAAQDRLEAVAGTRLESSARKAVGKLQQRLERLEHRLANPVLSTVALHFRCLSAAWNWAQTHHDDFPSRRLPMKSVRPTKEEIQKAVNDHRPTPDDLWKVIEHLDGWPRLAVTLLCATGARKTEIGTARWEGFNPEVGTLKVDGKTGEREVGLPPETVALLKACCPELARGRILAEVTVSTVQSGLPQHICNACAATKVSYFSVHSIRRMVTDLLYASNVDPSKAAAQLGHSPEIAMFHYRRVGPEEKRLLVSKAGLGAPPKLAKVVSLDARRSKSG